MIALALALACSADRPAPPPCEVYALQYGRSTFKKSNLVAGAPEDRVPFGWWAWLVRVSGHRVLVDTGFADPEVARRWRVEDFSPVPAVLEGFGVAPKSISDVVITHAHWDHVGHLAPYGGATIWLQDEELAWARSRVGPERPERGGVRLRDLEALDSAGDRLRTVSGDAEPIPGLVLHEGGHHTPHSQWVEVRCPERTVVLASDNAYLYENLETPVAIGSTSDAAANLAALRRMRATASSPRLVVPGPDPQVAARFEEVAPGVVVIR